jgi:hypothetical protein
MVRFRKDYGVIYSMGQYSFGGNEIAYEYLTIRISFI